MYLALGIFWVLAAGLALGSLAASSHLRRAQFAEHLLRIETQQRDAEAALERMQSNLRGSMQVVPGAAEGDRSADGCVDAPESGRTSAAAETVAIPEGRP